MKLALFRMFREGPEARCWEQSHARGSADPKVVGRLASHWTEAHTACPQYETALTMDPQLQAGAPELGSSQTSPQGGGSGDALVKADWLGRLGWG